MVRPAFEANLLHNRFLKPPIISMGLAKTVSKRAKYRPARHCCQQQFPRAFVMMFTSAVCHFHLMLMLHRVRFRSKLDNIITLGPVTATGLSRFPLLHLDLTLRLSPDCSRRISSMICFLMIAMAGPRIVSSSQFAAARVFLMVSFLAFA